MSEVCEVNCEYWSCHADINCAVADNSLLQINVCENLLIVRLYCIK